MFSIFSLVSLVGSTNCWSHLGKFSVFAFLPGCCGTGSEISAGCCCVLGFPGSWLEDKHWLQGSVLLSWAPPGDSEGDWGVLSAGDSCPVLWHRTFTCCEQPCFFLSAFKILVCVRFQKDVRSAAGLSLDSLGLQKDPWTCFPRGDSLDLLEKQEGKS